MNAFAGLLVLCLAVAAQGAATPRIVGGSDAPDGKYPYQVALKMQGSFSCGGSIINKRYILTAAHCIDYYNYHPELVETITVHAGTNLVTEKGVEYTAEKVITHYKYNAYDVEGDIGLIRVSRDIEFTDKIQPVQLAEMNKTYSDTAVLTGWGRLRVAGPIPKRLQELEVNVISNDQCRRVHSEVTDNRFLCTYTKLGEGACNGDSGGPLVAEGGIQIGIVSFGVPCALGRPDVFTRVAEFREWLRHNIKL